MIALLNNADASLIPYLAICAFAGLRSAECKSLTWGAVDLERKKIVVPENVSKTGQERTVPIAPNLTAWLLLAQFASNDYIYPGRDIPNSSTNYCVRLSRRLASGPGSPSSKTHYAKASAVIITKCMAVRIEPANMRAMTFGC